MTTPHKLFQDIFNSTNNKIAALRVIRQRFGLNFRQMKEIMLQAEEAASSLEEHEERLTYTLERVFRDQDDIPAGQNDDPSNRVR